MGARAVVAAGWAVNDAAARTFARTFYDLLFDGWNYGEAVAGAREATFKAHGDTNTWGAYQCYGDPSFSLGPIKSLESSPVPVAASEFVFEVDRLAARAAVGDLAEHERLRPAACRPRTHLRHSWLESSSVLTKLAEAYGELGDFETAASYYTRAMSDPHGDVPLRALEQLVNMQVRAARARMDERAARGTVVKWLREAEALLGRVERLGTICRTGRASRRSREVLGDGGRQGGEIPTAHARRLRRGVRAGKSRRPLGPGVRALEPDCGGDRPGLVQERWQPAPDARPRSGSRRARPDWPPA